MHQIDRRFRYTIEAAVLGLLALVVVAPWGCSVAPVAPETSVAPTFTLPNGIIAYPGTKLGEDTALPPGDSSTGPIYQAPMEKTVNLEGTFEESLDGTGGVVTMDVDGEVSYFVVPDGALTKTEIIRITVYRDQNVVDKRITDFHCEPEGLVFDDPAQLAFRSAMKEGSRLLLHLWDTRDQKWVEAAETVVIAGYATFPIMHFSDYRVTERISLGGQQNAD